MPQPSVISGPVRKGPPVEEKLEQLSYAEMFGNTNPVEIEIGCGRGKFLVARAQESSDRNFIGFDKSGKWMKRGITRADKQSLSNIHFIRAEAKKFLEEAVPPESVTVFHMYFPDPWPKRRHRSRRTISEDFLRLLHMRLLTGGLVEIATDDEDYFLDIKKGIALTDELWENIRETVNERILGGDMKTNYELKFESEGRLLHYVELRKK